MKIRLLSQLNDGSWFRRVWRPPAIDYETRASSDSFHVQSRFDIHMCGSLNKFIVHHSVSIAFEHSFQWLHANRFMEISLLPFISVFVSFFLRKNLPIQMTKDYASIRFTFQWNFSIFLSSPFASNHQQSKIRYHGRFAKRHSTSWTAWKWQKLLFQINLEAQSLCSLWLLVFFARLLLLLDTSLNHHQGGERNANDFCSIAHSNMLIRSLEPRVVSVTIQSCSISAKIVANAM